MNNLPKAKEPSEIMAIDVRRNMINIPEVIDALTPIERAMFKASTRDQIKDINQTELTDKVAKLAIYISRDAGIKKIDEYDVTRFQDILVKYYNNLSISEIKIAFEFAMAGELDSYLPKDKDGNPDKNHYQAFTVEYITKIINAYKKRKIDTEHKAYTALPNRSKLTKDKIDYYNKFTKYNIIRIYLEYKYRGKIDFNKVNAYILYKELDNIGYAEPVKVTEDDRREAVSSLLKKNRMGLINDFVADCIRHLRKKHTDVVSEAYIIAQERAIIKSLDNIVRNEIQINKLIWKQ